MKATEHPKNFSYAKTICIIIRQIIYQNHILFWIPIFHNTTRPPTSRSTEPHIRNPIPHNSNTSLGVKFKRIKKPPSLTWYLINLNNCQGPQAGLASQRISTAARVLLWNRVLWRPSEYEVRGDVIVSRSYLRHVSWDVCSWYHRWIGWWVTWPSPWG